MTHVPDDMIPDDEVRLGEREPVSLGPPIDGPRCPDCDGLLAGYENGETMTCPECEREVLTEAEKERRARRRRQRHLERKAAKDSFFPSSWRK